MSWRPEVRVEGKWEQNSLVFATKAEAEQYAADLFRRWTITTGHRAISGRWPVNYEIVDGVMRHLETPPEVPVVVIDNDGTHTGVLTADEHGDVVKLDEPADD